MTTSTDTMTREAWLERLVEEIRPLFSDAKQPLPERVRVSIGWPSHGGLSLKKQVLGECWDCKVSEDGVHHIFISPILTADELGHVLVHELCHAAAGYDAKHGPKFARLAKAVGLEGKPTSTTAGEDLTQRLNAMVQKIGPCPHAKLDPTLKEKKQSTRMKKLTCKCAEPRIIRASKKFTEGPGVLCRGCNAVFELEDEDGDWSGGE